MHNLITNLQQKGMLTSAALLDAHLMHFLIDKHTSKSEMIKNYKDCRGKSESFDKIFVLKNNQPDAVLFSIAEYKRLSVFMDIQ
jgi:hypothetical protein